METDQPLNQPCQSQFGPEWEGEVIKTVKKVGLIILLFNYQNKSNSTLNCGPRHLSKNVDQCTVNVRLNRAISQVRDTFIEVNIKI